MGDIIYLEDASAILGKQDIAKETVEVPEWGGTVTVKGLTGKERDSYEASMLSDADAKGERTVDMSNMRAKLVSRTVVKRDGSRVFTDAQVTKLGEKSAAALDRIFKVAQRLSKMTDDDVKELAEGLKVAPSEGSGSD